MADQRAVPPGAQLPLRLLFTSGKRDEECEGSEGKRSGTKPQMKLELKFVIMERSQVFSPLSASGSGRNHPDSSCSQGSSNSS